MVPENIETMQTKKKKFPMLAVVAVVLVVIGVLMWGKNNLLNRTSTDDAFIDGNVVAISPKVSGHISKVYIKDNQNVTEGDALFDIDERDYAVDLDLVQAGSKTAQAELDKATKDFARYKKLLATGDISEQLYDQAVFQLQSAQAKYDAALARLKEAQLNISYTKVTAPVTGKIARKNIEPGTFVQKGQSVVAIVPPQRWVTANFKETQLTHLQKGQKVKIKIDAYPSMILSGHVESLQEGTGSRFSLLPAENATGNFIKVVQRVPVKIVFDDLPQEARDLPLGLSVVPTVFLKEENADK